MIPENDEKLLEEPQESSNFMEDASDVENRRLAKIAEESRSLLKLVYLM